jgi:hypothetical protein
MKRRKYFERNEWRERVEAAFVRYWAAMKRLRLADPDDNTKWREAFDELGAASRELPGEASNNEDLTSKMVWKEIMRPLDGQEWSPPALGAGKARVINPEDSPFFRQLVFQKLGITYRELITELERDRGLYATLLKIHRDYQRLHTREASFHNLKLKFHFDHFSIMVQGLDYGLSELNERELASCFNEICPCAQRHSVEWLKKFRIRVKKACEHLRESRNKPTTINI